MTNEEARAIMTLLKQSYINFRTKSDLRKKTVKENIKAYDMAIKALEHPERNVVAVVPCGDTISRQAVLDVLDENSFTDSCIKVRQLPSVTPQEQKTGHWIEHKYAEELDGMLISNYKCSSCRCWSRIKSDYCPYCGAKMIGENEEWK